MSLRDQSKAASFFRTLIIAAPSTTRADPLDVGRPLAAALTERPHQVVRHIGHDLISNRASTLSLRVQEGLDLSLGSPRGDQAVQNAAQALPTTVADHRVEMRAGWARPPKPPRRFVTEATLHVNQV